MAQKWRAVSLNNKLAVVFAGATMLATISYTIVAAWTLREIRSGSADTHALAEAAKTQAEKMKAMSDAADRIKQASENMVLQEQRIADNAQKTMDASNKAARASLRQSERVWKSQQAPLLGIENNTITFPQIEQFIYPPVAREPTIWVGPIQFVVKNFGGGPAFHEFELVHVMPNPSRVPEQLEKQMCPMRQQQTKETKEGQFILQGAEIRSGVDSTNISPAPTDTNIKSVSIMICLSYQDAWGTVHHSRFIYATVPSQNQPITPIPTHPEWTYTQIGGLYLKSADTDHGENPN